MKHAIAILLFSLIALSCAKKNQIKGSFSNQKSESPAPPKDENNILDDDEEVRPPVDTKLNVACYLVDNNSSKQQYVCLDTVTALVPEAKAEYVYPDPFTDLNFPNGFNKNQYVAPNRLIDLDLANPEAQISKNFTADEFMQAHKGKYGIFSLTAMAKIQKMRDSLGSAINIHSAFRSPYYNHQIDGSARWSRHMYGDAIDFSASGASFEQLKDLCLKNGASFYQIYQSHIHCDWRSSELDEEFFPAATIPGPTISSLMKTAQDNAQIEVVRNQNSIALNIKSDFIEDNPEELSYSWQITHPNGRMTVSNETQAIIRGQRGLYQVRVIVGGSIEISREIHLQ